MSAAEAIAAPAALKQHYLFPCAIYCSREPSQVTTVLGSCVAVCLYDAGLKAGGINHYMLPFWNGEGLETPKYGNIAIPKLIEAMLKLGSSRKTMIAKVFGGGKVMGSRSGGGLAASVGQRNAEVAQDLLSEARITVAASSAGGCFGRKILFNTMTGEVLMKRVGKRNGHGQ